MNKADKQRHDLLVIKNLIKQHRIPEAITKLDNLHKDLKPRKRNVTR